MSRMDKFKIGDRIIHILSGEKGEVVPSEWKTMICVKFLTPDELHFSVSTHHNPDYFDLDVQYYREERFKKLLDI